MKAVQQLLYKHFNRGGRKNILYFATGSEYEKALLTLPYNFYKIGTSELNCYSNIGFDLVLSQGIQQIEEGKRISNVLHTPHIHLETEGFNGDNNLKNLGANEIVSSWNWVAQSWGRSDVIVAPKEIKPSEDPKDLSCIYLDIDQQTANIAGSLAQHFPIKQLMADQNDFKDVGILVSLVQSPVHQARLLQAASQGTVVVTWNHPFFQDIVMSGTTGYLVNNPDEMAQAIHNLLSNPGLIQTLSKTTLNTIKAKFGKKSFEDKWKKVISKFDNFIFKG